MALGHRSVRRKHRLDLGLRRRHRWGFLTLQALNGCGQGLDLLYQDVELFWLDLGNWISQRWRILDRVSRTCWKTSGGIGGSFASQLHGHNSGPSFSANCCWKLDPEAAVG